MNWGLVGGVVASLIAVWLLFIVVLWIFRPRGTNLGRRYPHAPIQPLLPNR